MLVGVTELVGVTVKVIVGVTDGVDVFVGVGVGLTPPLVDVGVGVWVCVGVGVKVPKTVTFLETVSSLQPGCLLTTNISYCVPVDKAGKSKTTPAVIWSRV